MSPYSWNPDYITRRSAEVISRTASRHSGTDGGSDPNRPQEQSPGAATRDNGLNGGLNIAKTSDFRDRKSNMCRCQDKKKKKGEEVRTGGDVLDVEMTI